MTIAIATPVGRTACDALIKRLLKVRGHVIPTLAEEQAVQAAAPGFPSVTVVRADVGGRIIGAATLGASADGFMQQVDNGRPMAEAVLHARRWQILTHLAVEPAHRGKGIGRQLVGHLEAAARAAGARGIFGLAEDHDRPSGAFYERCGYTVLDYDQPLPPLGGVQVQLSVHRRGRMFFKRLGPAS